MYPEQTERYSFYPVAQITPPGTAYTCAENKNVMRKYPAFDHAFALPSYLSRSDCRNVCLVRSCVGLRVLIHRGTLVSCFRPVNFHMPMRALLTVQRFSLAVNLNTKTNYTPLK